MGEFLSTIWDYICHALGWLLAWTLLIGGALGSLGLVIGFFKGEYSIGPKLDEIADELKKLNAKNKTKE